MARRGDIMLVSGKGWVSRSIKRITKSPWSHAAWVLTPETVLESDWQLFGNKGIQVSQMKKYAGLKVAFVRPLLADAEIDKALDYALSKAGQRYDFSLFFGLLRDWFIGHFAFLKRGPVRNQRHGWICSELVATPLNLLCGFRFTEYVDPRNIKPGDIWASERSTKL